MHRIPRIAPVLIGLAALVALLAVASASGRSQTAPTNSAEPTITYVHPIKIATILTGNKGTWNGTTPLDYAYQWLRCDDNVSTPRSSPMRPAPPTRSSRPTRTTRSVST